MHYDITPEMTTTDVCDQFIKPYTFKRKCCYVDLLAAEEDPNRPDGWVGKTTHFTSHWWGYPFLTVLEMLRAHSARLKAAGLPRAFYFFDAFTINQHTFFLGSTEENAAQSALVTGLRDSLIACGRIVLCCTTGPSGESGWEKPAPLYRIWCLFEIFHSMKEDLEIEMQLSTKDEREFRVALQKDGMARIEESLRGIDVSTAQASVDKDRAMILESIKQEISLDDFNQFVRRGLLKEFRAIAVNAVR